MPQSALERARAIQDTAKGATPEAQPRALPSPPSDPRGTIFHRPEPRKQAAAGRFADWLFSKKAVAAAARVGPMMYGSMKGFALGAPFGPVGAVGGAIVGGAAGGAVGSVAGQALEGTPLSDIDKRDVIAAMAIGGVPVPAWGKAPGLLQWVARQAKVGASYSATYDIINQTYVEGTPLTEVNLNRTLKHGAVGAGVGAAVGAAFPHVAPTMTGKGGVVERVGRHQRTGFYDDLADLKAKMNAPAPKAGKPVEPPPPSAAGLQRNQEAIANAKGIADEIKKAKAPTKATEVVGPDGVIQRPQPTTAAEAQQQAQVILTEMLVPFRAQLLVAGADKGHAGRLVASVRKALDGSNRAISARNEKWLRDHGLGNVPGEIGARMGVALAVGGAEGVTVPGVKAKKTQTTYKTKAGAQRQVDKLTTGGKYDEVAAHKTDKGWEVTLVEKSLDTSRAKAAGKTARAAEAERRKDIKTEGLPTQQKVGELEATISEDGTQVTYETDVDTPYRPARITPQTHDSEPLFFGKLAKPHRRPFVELLWAFKSLNLKGAAVASTGQIYLPKGLQERIPTDLWSILGQMFGFTPPQNRLPEGETMGAITPPSPAFQRPDAAATLPGEPTVTLPGQKPKGGATIGEALAVKGQARQVVTPELVSELPPPLDAPLTPEQQRANLPPAPKVKAPPKDTVPSEKLRRAAHEKTTEKLEAAITREGTPPAAFQAAIDELQTRHFEGDALAKKMHDPPRVEPPPGLFEVTEPLGTEAEKALAGLEGKASTTGTATYAHFDPIAGEHVWHVNFPGHRLHESTVPASDLTDVNIPRPPPTREGRQAELAWEEKQARGIKKLLGDETGSFTFGPAAPPEPIHVLADEPKLQSVHEVQQEALKKELAALLKGRKGAGTLGDRAKMALLNERHHLAVASRVLEESIILDSATHPARQADILIAKVGGKTAGDWARMIDGYQRMVDARLDEAFVKAMNLGINVRAENTAAQHLENARDGRLAAQEAVDLATAGGAKKKVLTPLKTALRRADRLQDRALAEWSRVTRGVGLQGGYMPGESSTVLKKLEDELNTMDPAYWLKVQETLSIFEKLHDDALTDAIFTGTVSQDLADQFRLRGPYVAPMQRLARRADTIEELRYRSAGRQKLGVVSPLIQAQFQAKTPVGMHPVLSSMKHIATVHRENWINYMTALFVDQLRKAPEFAGDIQLVKKNDTVPDHLAKVPVMRDGRVEWWTLRREIAEIAVNPSRLELELRGLGPLKWLQYTKTALTRGATTYNPAFQLRNTPRDVGAARVFVPEAFEHGNPLDAAKSYVEYAKALKRLKGDPHGVQDPGVRAFYQAGAGLTTLQQTLTPQSFVGDRLLKRLQGLAVTGREGWLGSKLNAVNDLASGLEVATKLMTFERLHAAGYTEDHAAYLTREFGGSPNFSRKGTLGPVMDLLFMFLGPSIRGVEQSWTGVRRLAKLPVELPRIPDEAAARGASDAYDNAEIRSALGIWAKKRGARRIKQVLAAMAGTAILYELWNHQPMFIDEEGEPYINRLSPDLRNQNWVLLLPLPHMFEQTESGPMPRSITIAKPHINIVLQSPIEKAINFHLFEEVSDYTEMWGGVTDLAEGISPIQFNIDPGQGVSGMVANAMMASSNPLFGASADLIANTNSRFGGPIVPRRLEETFAERKFSERGFRLITRVVGAANENVRNAIGVDFDIPPAYVEHWLERASPGPYRAARELAEGVEFAYGLAGVEGARAPRGMDFDAVQTASRVTLIIGGMLRTLLGAAWRPDARLRELQSEFYREARLAKKRHDSALDINARDSTPEAEAYYERAPAGQTYTAYLAFQKQQDHMAAVRRERGDLFLALDKTRGFIAREALVTKMAQLNNRQLAWLRDWKKEKDERYGR